MPRAGYANWDEDDAFDIDDERPSRRARIKPLRWLRLILMSSLCIAGLVYFALDRQRGEQPSNVRGVPSTTLIAPAPVWKPISPTPAVYALGKNQDRVTLEARQHKSGAREDTLILGSFGDASHARITLVQGFAEPEGSFFIDIVRRAAGAGLAVERNAQSRMVATKFGPMEAAAVTLTGQTCQAFRYSDPQAGFGFQGWLCGSEADAMDDIGLACFIDGIALVGGTNPSLRAVFARAERNRIEACGPGARTASVSVKAPRRP